MPPSQIENFKPVTAEHQPQSDFGIDMTSAGDSRLAMKADYSCPATSEQIPIDDGFGTIKNQPTEYGKWLVEQNTDALNEKPSDTPVKLNEQQQQIADKAMDIVQEILDKKYAGNHDIRSEINQLQDLFGGSKSSLNFRLPKEFFAPISEYLKQQFNEKFNGVVAIGTSDVTGQTYLGFNRGTLQNPDFVPMYNLGGRADCSQFNGSIN